MRYVISQADPELKEEARLFNTFRQACDSLACINTINEWGNNNHEFIRAFIARLRQDYAHHPAGLRGFLTQEDNDGWTPLLHRAASNNNPEVIRALLASLQQAFAGNLIGLQQALTQDNDGSTPLRFATFNDNPEVRALLQAAINQVEAAIDAQQENQ